MFRPVCAAFSALFLIVDPAAAQTTGEAVPPASTVFFSRDAQAFTGFVENPVSTGRMVDELVLAVTRKPNLAQAWRSLVSPKDRVGIKVATAGGLYFSSRVGVVEAILRGLEQGGVPRRQVTVWDRDDTDLRAAGFDAARLGCKVRSIEPIRGYDRSAMFAAPVLGKLIWGDLLFSEKAQKIRGKKPKEADQLSSTSHLANVVTKEITKIINLPMITDSPGCGVAGALYNLTVPNVDNWRRFTQRLASAAESLAELYADDHIQPKVVFTLLDGLFAQYAGGPGGNPNYAFAHATLYASRDPVALDATALRLMEGWRKEAKLPPIGARAEWLQVAGQMGLGAFEEERIALQEVPLRR